VTIPVVVFGFSLPLGPWPASSFFKSYFLVLKNITRSSRVTLREVLKIFLVFRHPTMSKRSNDPDEDPIELGQPAIRTESESPPLAGSKVDVELMTPTGTRKRVTSKNFSPPASPQWGPEDSPGPRSPGSQGMRRMKSTSNVSLSRAYFY